MRTARPFVLTLVMAAALPAGAQINPGNTPLEPIGQPPVSQAAKPVPPPKPTGVQGGIAQGASAAAAAAKDAAAQAATAAGAGANLPKEAMPTFNVPSRNQPASSGTPSALKLPDPNAPLNPPVTSAAKVVPAPVATPAGVPARAQVPTGMPPGAMPPGAQGSVTSAASNSQGGVMLVPGTGGPMVTPSGDGMPPTPNYPPAPLLNDLPGLGRAPGSQAPGKPQVVRSVPGVNDIIPISKNFPNRIATPFNDPVWVDQGTANIDKLHSSVFITPKSDRPIQIFITENNDPTAAVVQLTLLPRTIPGQTVVVEIEGYDPVAAAKRLAKDPKREAQMPDQYTDRMLFLLREVARGRSPDGYTEEALSVPVANLPGGVQVLPEKRYSGSTYDIYRYRIRNAGTQRITLQEQSFYQKGVRAVAFFPLLQLAVGQETAVHIITSKDGE